MHSVLFINVSIPFTEATLYTDQGKSSANIKQFADFEIAFLLLKRINFNLSTGK